jgi:hypothetical protein
VEQRSLSRVFVVLFLMASACEGPAVFTDLAKGLVPEPEDGYESGGRFLHEGEFHALSLEVVPPSYDFALAIDSKGDLLVCAIGSGESCWLRDVVAYQPAIWRSLDFDEALLPFVRNDDGVETLHFADFDCRVRDISVPNGRVVDYLPLPDDRGVLVEGDDRHVILVSPWNETTQDLGIRILDDGHPFRHSLLVKNGKLVLYDGFLQPLAAFGEDVVDARVLPDMGELVLVQADGSLGAVPLDDGSGTVSWLADDACGLFDAGPLGDIVAFYSPCAAERLVLYRPAPEGLEGETFPLVVDAQQPEIVTRSLALEKGIEAEALSVAFFRGLDQNSRAGALWAQSVEEAPYLLGEGIATSWFLPAFDRDAPLRKVAALALELAANDDHTLVAVDGEQRVPIAERVTRLYESGASLVLLLGNGGGSSDLVLLESLPFEGVALREPELLLSNALAGLELSKTPVLDAVVDEAGLRVDDGDAALSLFRTDSEHGHTLYLLRQSYLDASFEQPLALLEGAAEQYSFSNQVPESVLALVGSSTRGADLRQTWYSRGLETTVASGVTSYFESTYPERGGLLYATTGNEQGLYYAGLK